MKKNNQVWELSQLLNQSAQHKNKQNTAASTEIGADSVFNLRADGKLYPGLSGTFSN